MSKNPKYNIAQIIQQALPILEQQQSLSGHQKSVLKLIQNCKTAILGGHIEQCNSCGHTRIHYNSCSNRNCPSCQAVNKEKWIFDLQFDLLPVKYFHCVFTVPSELHIYFRYNKKMMYDLMMRCAKDTLLTFGQDPKHGISGKIGVILLLHTWTQQLTYHPHVHCIVPSGGIQINGTWKQSEAKGDFLFPVKAMANLFRGKLLANIHQLFIEGKLHLNPGMKTHYWTAKNKLYNIQWNTYAKKAFGGPQQVLEYIGRYTHKICISNYRIEQIEGNNVTFRFTDRKVNQTKSKTIKTTQFLKLFAEHILTKGFVRIRHIGFLASRSNTKDLKSIRSQLNATSPAPKPKLTTREFVKLTTGKDPYQCSCCNKGEMVIISILPTIRGSPSSAFFKSFAKDRIVQIF